MLKVLIADDEKKVCRLIQMLCDWEALDMELVGTAYDGPDALRQIEAQSPDILITDICMPGCDGIEIIRQARERQISLEVLIISGYADFAYAQSAIHYGVSDYLLKPIKKEELNSTLAKMAERCKSEKLRLSESRQLLEYVESDQLRNRSRLFFELLLASPRREIPEMDELGRQYGYRFSPGYFRILILKLDCDIRKYDERSIRPILTNLEEQLRAALLPVCSELESYSHGSRCYFLCNYEAERRREFRQAARRGAEQIAMKRFQFWEAEFSVGMGKSETSTGGLFASLDSAEEAVCERLFEGCGKLLVPRQGAEEGPAPQRRGNADDLEHFYRQFRRAAELRDVPESAAAVETLKSSAISGEQPTGAELFGIVRAAGIHAITLICKEDAEEKRLAFLRECDFSSTVDRLFAVLAGTVCGLVEEEKKQAQEENRRPVRIAREYILHHYMEPITLDEVADVAGFSSSYFSGLFKKETGRNFADYLIQLRMDRAKELLRDTRKSVRDICSEVGYRDLKHFTMTFQKYTGLKPGAFRKLYS